MKTHLLTFAFLLIACAASAQDNSFDDLMKQGIELHDAGNYEAAIEKYNEALKLQPDSKLALYEIAFSYSAMKKYDESIEYGRKALASSNGRHTIDLMIYNLMGSDYDDIGKPEEAIKIYDEGLAKSENYLLYYNKGLTYHRMDSLETALGCYKKALALKVSHPASNLNIARIYVSADDIVSAFFYYVYFMLFEPNTNRTRIAFDELFATGEGYNITIPADDQQLLHLTLSIAFKAALELDKEEKISEITPYNKLLDVFKVVYSMKDQVELNKLNDDICASYYAPMFFAACEDGYMELLCRYLTHALDEESQAWIKENDSKLDSFFIWLNAFGQITAEGE